MPYLFRGIAVLPTTEERDREYNRWEDYIQSVMEVVPWPDNTPAPGTLPDGLAKWSNYHGTDHTGPAFSVSLKIPNAESDGTPGEPDEGNGRATVMANEIDDRPDAEFGWSTLSI
jgi:hypothetical protein